MTTVLLLLLACGDKDDGGPDDTGPRVEDCDDTRDNDGNGLADCADPACQDEPGCDSGTTDGGTPDGGTSDGGTPDGGTTDGGTTDGGTTGAWSRGDLFVNELMASNATTVADETGAFPDWIELYNPGTTDISLSGWTISDDLLEPGKHELDGSLSVPAGGFLLLWADEDADQGALHLGFKLSAKGEAVGIFAPDGTDIDSTTFGPQATDVSAARRPDGASTWVLADPATPGASNGAAR